jgi:hypothetical protein
MPTTPSITPTSSLTDSLIALKTQYERSLTQANTNASHLREQLLHVNALLLNQLLQGNGVVPELAQGAAEVPVVEAIAPAPAQSLAASPAAEASASDRPKPKASPRKAKATAEPALASGKRSTRPLLPAYAGLTRLEAIAQVLEASAGSEVSIDALIHALFGELSATDRKAERKRLITLLYNGEKRGLWQKGSATLSYVISASTAKAPATAKPTTQANAKAKPTTAPAKSRRSLDVLPAYRGMSKREAIAQILEQRSGEVLHQDMIIQSLYGDLSPQDVKNERVRIKTALLTGVKDGKWQKAFEPSSYFIKAPTSSAKPKRPGRKPEPSKEPKPEPVAQTKSATVKQRSSLDVLPAFEGLSKLDAIAAVLGQAPGEVLHQDTIIQTLYGDLRLEDLKKERVRIDTSLRNGVKANKWKKAPVPASYVLDAIAPAPPAKATGAKPKSERKPAVAKVKPGRKPAIAKAKTSQKTARSKKTELELVALLRKADIQV